MSRRYVKKAKFNSLDQITPEIVAVVSAKDNLQTVDDQQQFFKRNYLEAIKKIIPKFYFHDEAVISGSHVSYPNQLINSHILANKNQSTILPVSALTDDLNDATTSYLSSIDTPSGFAQYFYKQRSPAQVDPDDFQRNILGPLGVKYKNYSTSQAFANYVSGTLLPSIPLVCTGHQETADLATLTTSAFSNDSSGTYKYLVNNLGWLYFLNRSGPADSGGLPGYDASVGLTDLFVDTLWQGRSVVLQDTLSLYQEYLWKNEPIWGLSDKITPVDYVSSLDTSTGIYTSGTQVVERLKTLASIVYSPHYLDSTDNKVEEAFTTYFNTSSPTYEGTLITDTEEIGPLTRFLEAMSFEFADRVTEQAELNVLYDIGRCPEEFLDLLGELIGWKFIGGDYDKWRVQLRNAVDIYKMKGTKRSIQYLMDTLFSTGVFKVTGDSTLLELWESYIPDLIYYSLATSSAALQNFDTYTPELALQFGVAHYDPTSMDTNIKYLVDKILFDLVREFPQSFILGNEPFPTPHLLLDGEPYVDKYNIVPQPPQEDVLVFPKFLTGDVSSAESEELTLDYDPNFLFKYRNRIALVPPYEKRQYYIPTQVSMNMLNRIEYYLRCYGVDKAFAKQVFDYMWNNLSNSVDTVKVLNGFLIFTNEKTYPPNYAQILQDATKERTPDPLTLLSLWNGKSSHFSMSFNADSFDWTTQQLTAGSKYAMSKVMRVIEQVIPAHSIPEVLLSVSSVEDSLDALSDNDCREWRPNVNDLYEGSSTVTTGFAVCAVNMGAIAQANGITPHRFKRNQVDNVNDVLLSGSTFQFGADLTGSGSRNSLRRRNYKNLLPETKMFTRLGRNNPGSLELSTTYYTSNTGYIPLGFMPSALRYKEVALKQNNSGMGIGQIIDNLDPVWADVCYNLSSSESVFGYDVSNTFASRAKQSVASSDCNTYGRRGQLPEILYIMNKVHDQEKYLQASSIVSGFLLPKGNRNPDWDVSSSLLIPTDFSSWYAEDSEYGGLDVPKSMGTYLINQESGDESLNYYENFSFGRKIQEFFKVYNTTFSGNPMMSNYDLIGGPNLFSHTYGPMIYNSNFDIDGTTLNTSGWLAASAPTYEVDLSYYGGSGVLSASGMNGKGNHNLGTSAASDSGDLPIGKAEFRNRHLVSSIELVDSSSAYLFSKHPIFSIYNLSRDDQSKYSFAKYLINNQIIKYHRSSAPDLFPRLRLRINPNDYTDLSRDFLEPNHEYEVTVKAHNLDISSTDLGGLRLGFWIHTDPENDQVWSYLPLGIYGGCNVADDTWKALNVASLSSTAGINMVHSNSQSRGFVAGNLENLVGSGEGGQGPITEYDYDYRCWDPLTNTRTLDLVPQMIASIGSTSLNELKFKFSTKNNKTFTRSPEYVAQYGEVHRLNQNYTLEFFAMKGDDRKFIVFEDISIQDITNYNKAVIQTKYGDAQLDLKDLKAVFRFFRGLSTGSASRNATMTSGIMEVSGGSRLNYRSNVAMYPHGLTGTNNQLGDITINEG